MMKTKTIAQIVADINQAIQDVPESSRTARLSNQPSLVYQAVEDAFIESEDAQAAIAKHHLTSYVRWSSDTSVPTVRIDVYPAQDSPICSIPYKFARSYDFLACKRQRDKVNHKLQTVSVRLSKRSRYWAQKNFEDKTVSDFYEQAARDLVIKAAPLFKSIEILESAIQILGKPALSQLLIAAKRAERVVPEHYQYDVDTPYLAPTNSIYNPEFVQRAAAVKKACIGNEPADDYRFSLVETGQGIMQKTPYSIWESPDKLITLTAWDHMEYCNVVVDKISPAMQYIRDIRTVENGEGRPMSVSVVPSVPNILEPGELDEYISQLITARRATKVIQYMFIDNWTETRKALDNEQKINMFDHDNDPS